MPSMYAERTSSWPNGTQGRAVEARQERLWQSERWRERYGNRRRRQFLCDNVPENRPKGHCFEEPGYAFANEEGHANLLEGGRCPQNTVMLFYRWKPRAQGCLLLTFLAMARGSSVRGDLFRKVRLSLPNDPVPFSAVGIGT